MVDLLTPIAGTLDPEEFDDDTDPVDALGMSPNAFKRYNEREPTGFIRTIDEDCGEW